MGDLSPLPPPGWYPDPGGSGRRRYFDGARWGPFEPLSAAGRTFSVQYGGRPPGTVDTECSTRSRWVAGLLQFFFGHFGLGRFYLGYYSSGAVQLTLGVVGIFGLLLCYIGLIILIPLSIWVMIEAVIMLAGSMPDAEGKRLR